jgi:hypothetical protein
MYGLFWNYKIIFLGKMEIRYQLILQTTLTPLFTRTLHICTNLNMLLGGCPVKGQKDSHLQADNKMSLRQEKAEIRSAVIYLIKNFDESKSTSYFLTRLRRYVINSLF